MGFGEHRVGLGGRLGCIYGFGGISFSFGGDPVLVCLFFICFVVSIGFRWDFQGHLVGKV